MKIGLIAMSGIRVCDAELLDLGLTLPGFVERSKVIASLPSLGLLTLAGMTPPDCELHYMEVADLEADGNIDGDFDLCAISTFSVQANEAYRLGKRLAEGGAQVVIGGLHVTTMPDEPASYGISAAVGEGESIWPQIIEDARHGKLKQLYDARRTSFDLADAPMPAFELLDVDRYNRLTVQTSRGCPHRCTFCASSILLTRSYKQKPAHKVLAEIDKIRALGHRSFIELADDNSFVNHSYWKALLPELEKRHIKWFTETDISISDDEELLRAMRKAGCSQVLIGLERSFQLRSRWCRSTMQLETWTGSRP